VHEKNYLTHDLEVTTITSSLKKQQRCRSCEYQLKVFNDHSGLEVWSCTEKVGLEK